MSSSMTILLYDPYTTASKTYYRTRNMTTPLLRTLLHAATRAPPIPQVILPSPRLTTALRLSVLLLYHIPHSDL
jgi:hypothetical protein